MSTPKWITAIGGRKALVLLFVLAVAVVLGATGNLNDSASDLLLMLFGSFCGGNALEHLGKGIGERINRTNNTE